MLFLLNSFWKTRQRQASFISCSRYGVHVYSREFPCLNAARLPSGPSSTTIGASSARCKKLDYFIPTRDPSNLPTKESPHETSDMSPKTDPDEVEGL